MFLFCCGGHLLLHVLQITSGPLICQHCSVLMPLYADLVCSFTWFLFLLSLVSFFSPSMIMFILIWCEHTLIQNVMYAFGDCIAIVFFMSIVHTYDIFCNVACTTDYYIVCLMFPRDNVMIIVSPRINTVCCWK